MARIEQHAPVIRTFYFLDDKPRDPSDTDRVYRDEDYQKFMDELTSFSFSTRNLHDDAPDSCAGLVDYFMTGSTTASIFKRPF